MNSEINQMQGKFNGRAELIKLQEAGDPHFEDMNLDDLSDEAVELFAQITMAQTKDELKKIEIILHKRSIDAPPAFYALMRNKIMNNPNYFNE